MGNTGSSTTRLVLSLLGLVGAVVVLAAVGAPTAVIVIVASGIGAVAVGTWMASKRTVGAHAFTAAGVDAFPVQLPADRVAVGPALQFRLLPPARNVWAPGLVCVAQGEVAFVPSEEKRRDRSWRGPVDSAEVSRLHANACVLRVSGRDGAAQFVVHQNVDDVRASVGRFVAIIPPRSEATGGRR